MPDFTFDFNDEEKPTTVSLADADEAWSQVVTAVGEMLKDVDGKLPPHADWLIKGPRQHRYTFCQHPHYCEAR